MNDIHHTILITAAESETLVFGKALEALGYRLLHHPLQTLLPPESWAPFDEALDAVSSYSGIIAPNHHAASGMLARLAERGIDPAALPDLYAVGRAAGDALAQAGVASTLVPGNASPGDLDAVFTDVSNQFYLLVGTAQPARGFTDYIAERGGMVNNVPVYRLSAIGSEELRALDVRLIEGGVDCLAFFAPAAVRTFASRIPDFKQATLLIAVQDQQTAAAVSGSGLRVDIIASQPTQEDFARSIADRFASDKRVDLDPDLHMDYA
jgi:uroporphyrinogen-III synthase